MSGSVPIRKRAPQRSQVEAAFRKLLEALGIDPTLPALAETPKRAAEAYIDVLTRGYDETPIEALGRGFPVQEPGPVVATRIPVLFTCPHHLLPARGLVHLGFVPKARAPGLSRITRLVDTLAHRLVLQEDLGEGIVRALKDGLDVTAAIAIVEARHACVAVEDFARAETVFRTRSVIGPKSVVASLDSEIGASLSAPWISASGPPTKRPASKSQSRRRRKS